jgi:hypothetical protein
MDNKLIRNKNKNQNTEYQNKNLKNEMWYRGIDIGESGAELLAAEQVRILRPVVQLLDRSHSQ